MYKTTYIPIVLAIGVFSTPYSLAESATDAQKRPNIIFILADDLGYGEVGCFGQEKIKTPTIDRLANEGLRLTAHYSGSPVCAPSRCSLLTGMHTGHAIVRNNRELGGWGPEEPEGQFPLPEGTPTLSLSLQEAGYATGAFGKWGLGGPNTTGLPNDQGFDEFYGYLCQRVAHNYYPTHLWKNKEIEMLQGNDRWFSAHQKIDTAIDFQQFSASTYAPDRIIEEAVEFIDTHADEPFLVYFASTIPHLALQIPEEELDAYPTEWDKEPYLGDKGYLPHPRPRAAYAAMITRFDAEVGALLEAVERNGVADNTIIIVTSDNGPSWIGGVDMEFFDSSGGLRGRKAQLFEGGIRVPTVVWWPSVIEAGSENNSPSSFWDWYPTLMQVSKGNAPACDGVSLVPILTGNDKQKRRGLYWEHGNVMVYRNGDWKLMLKKTKQGTDVMLFNLRNDPSEQINRAEEFQAKVNQLKQEAMSSRTASIEFPSFLDKEQ